MVDLGVLEELASRLSRRARRLLERGVVEAVRRGDVAALYHYASFSERDAYIDIPRPRWPGFFREHVCRGFVSLPEPPERLGGGDLGLLVKRRRSRRRYRGPLGLGEVSILLYYSVGITGWDYDWPLRAYPSAGGLQPVEAYLVAVDVEGLEPGVYHYDPREHSLCLLRPGVFGERLASICLEQDHVAGAPASLVYTVVYTRTASKYHARAYRYVHLDAGAVMQNVYLAAEALGLATVAVGAFYDEELCGLLGIDCYTEFPVLVMPVGRRA